MKECPICHTQYDDSINFCTKDGCQLIVAESSNTHTMTSPQKPKKGIGCLKMTVIAGVVIVIALIACYNYFMNAATYLRVEPNQIGFVKSGGDCKVDIDYDGFVWTINHKPDWVSIDENTEDFVIKVGPNQTGEIQEGSITIQSGKHLAQVVIKQMEYATRIKTSENSLKFSSSGGKETIAIETDGCGWEAQSPDWVKVIKNNDGATIYCDDNYDEYRTGKIEFVEDNVSAKITITQGGTCNICHGSGYQSCSFCWGQGGYNSGFFYSQCSFCGGAGKFKCSTCKGTGERE